MLVLNGVNLGRLGARQPDVYGAQTHADLVQRCQRRGAELGLGVEVRQTDAEAELVGWLHEAADAALPVVLNPAAWSHYSVAVADAVAQRTADLIEVHISNIARPGGVPAPLAGLGLRDRDDRRSRLRRLRARPDQDRPQLTLSTREARYSEGDPPNCRRNARMNEVGSLKPSR